MRTFWIVVLVVACGTPRPSMRGADEGDRSAAERSRAGGSVSSETETGPPPTGRVACPAAFDSPGPRCEHGEDPGDCRYPEGECYCGSPSHCSGAEPIPTPLQWICQARVVCGPNGTPCAPGSPPCGNTCCGAATSCIGGVWVSQMVPCPP